jgi:hypothetical protein
VFWSLQKLKRRKPKKLEHGNHLSEISRALESTIIDCRKSINKVSETLKKLEKSRKATLAIKWQFLEPEVLKLTQEVERFKATFVLCLGVDTRCADKIIVFSSISLTQLECVRMVSNDILNLQTQMSLHLPDIKDEQEKEKIAAQKQRQRTVSQAFQSLECSRKTGLDRQALFRWLVPKSDDRHEKASQIGTPDTGDWIFDRSEFICWAEAKDSLLWLNGIRKHDSSKLYGTSLTIECSWVWEDNPDVFSICSLICVSP